MVDNSLIHYRNNYTEPTHLIEKIDITFDIFQEYTKVISRMIIQKNPTSASDNQLFLHGTAKLISLNLDGEIVAEHAYTLKKDGLLIHEVPENFILEVRTELYPQNNTSLMGLYASNRNLFTQCEPEGFRQITYYLDRPDVMSRFSTTIIADKISYPILLSNGNKIGEGTADKNRHWVKWIDPYRKPSYLFALVAGKLVANNNHFISKSGRNINLQIWTEPADKQRTEHAMKSIQRAMRWDEERFKLEYDLDIFMIVAVGDFNMGAMENKGLNIFNTQYVLADKETATDNNFKAVESVIGHEYFHNWTGNRVTCRDWFQLSLKEGLTVFRDQEFSADMNDAAVERIEDIKRLRTVQFPEDAGPTAHPIRPDSYIEMNNFYTATVYEKGAEIVRMYQTLLGKNGFAKGLALYIKRHDGQAVTCDDFLNAMADANDVDLSQFSLWYQQSGTPTVNVSSNYNAEQKEFTLTFQQIAAKKSNIQSALYIPIKVGLLDKNGADLELHCKNSTISLSDNSVLSLRKQQESFTFSNIEQEPIPSLLRGFSAPIYLNYAYNYSQLSFLMMHDSDHFSRWQAAQSLIQKEIHKLYSLAINQQPLVLESHIIKAFQAVLSDQQIDPAFKTLMLTLPNENEMLEWLEKANPLLICQVRNFLQNKLANELKAHWEQIFSSLKNQPTDNAGLRSLKNLALFMLNQTTDESAINAAQEQFIHSENMTEQMGALLALNNKDSQQRRKCMNYFSQRWQDNMLVMDKYFSLIAQSRLPQTLIRVKEAMNHPAFNLKNPNKVGALIGTFGKNMEAFHAQDGSGYNFMAQNVKQIDKFNPQLASRLVQAFNRHEKLEQTRASLMQNELKQLLDLPDLSKDVREIITKSVKPF